MSEVIYVALISSIIGGVVVALINKLPEWRKVGAEVKKIEADTDKTAVETLKMALDAQNDRLNILENEMEKKVKEAATVTCERDMLLAEVGNLTERVGILERMNRELIKAFREFLANPKDKLRFVILLDEMETRRGK